MSFNGEQDEEGRFGKKIEPVRNFSIQQEIYFKKTKGISF